MKLFEAGVAREHSCAVFAAGFPALDVPAALTAAIEPFLPVACVFALLWGAFPAQRERLIQRVGAALR